MTEGVERSILRLERMPLIFAGALAFARLVGLLSMTLEGLRGYGDFPTFFHTAELPGWPFLQYWVEFPPLFPFLNALIQRLSGGQEHVYNYLFSLLLIAADTGNVYLFTRLAQKIHIPGEGLARSGAYLLVLISLAYGWWYLDPMAVFWMLLALALLLEGRAWAGGAAAALGIATKLFPGLALLAGWRRFSFRRLIGLLAFTLTPLVAAYLLLWLASPGFTLASIRSQGAKGSWETPWALLDGNLRTGSFGNLADRLDPAKVYSTVGNPAVIPPLVTLVLFASLGLLGMWKAGLLRAGPPLTARRSLALVGFGLGLFMLWSPGWSPQWLLYLLPLILLVLPGRQAYLLGAALALVNLLEWPILLSRGYFTALPLTVLLRTFLLLVLTIAFYQEMALGNAEGG